VTVPVCKRERLLPYWLLSLVLHLVAVVLFVRLGGGRVSPPPVRVIEVELEELDRRPEQQPAGPAATPPRKKERHRSPSGRIEPAAPEAAQPRRSERQAIPVADEHETPASPEPSSVQKNDTTPAPRTTRRDSSPGEAPTLRPSGATKVEVAPDGRYLAQIRGLIERRKEYPVPARKTGQEGTTMVSFILGKNGELKEARIAVSSGRTLLDRAALRAVENVGRFPPFPVDTWGDSRTFQAPISFRIE